jgi:hypothetical protein
MGERFILFYEHFILLVIPLAQKAGGLPAACFQLVSKLAEIFWSCF